MSSLGGRIGDLLICGVLIIWVFNSRINIFHNSAQFHIPFFFTIANQA
jgi:hypothetical protein